MARLRRRDRVQGSVGAKGALVRQPTWWRMHRSRAQRLVTRSAVRVVVLGCEGEEVAPVRRSVTDDADAIAAIDITAARTPSPSES